MTKWKIPGNNNSHPLALDEVGRRLFTAALQPGRFTVVETEGGTGAGAIDVFQQHDADRYAVLARIPVGAGAGSTSYHLKTRTQDSLYMSWPNMLSQGGSDVLLFFVND